MKISLKKKLALGKKTIATLNPQAMSGIFGGTSIDGPQTLYPRCIEFTVLTEVDCQNCGPSTSTDPIDTVETEPLQLIM